MIHVLASIQVKPGKRNAFLEIFKTNVPNVLQEEGCVEYSPAVDIDAGLPPQVLNENIVTIIEKWGTCLLYTSPSPRDRTRSRMPSSA